MAKGLLPIIIATWALRYSLQDEVPMVREYVQVSGTYVQNAVGEHVFENQIYVEHLVPMNGTTQPYPLVMIHGSAQTATNWLNKPDGGRGWASLFIEQGYELYLVDQPSRGRSTWQPDIGPAIQPPNSVEYIQRYFTAVERYNIWPQAAKHTQWNGSGLMGDPTFDRFYSSQVQYTSNLTYQQVNTQAAGAALLDLIAKPTIIVGHSSGGPMPMGIADARPDLVAGLILIEPAGPPFTNQVPLNGSARAWGVADIPLTYDPVVIDPSVDLVKQIVTAPDAEHDDCILQADHPQPRKLANLAETPILIVTSESSYHAPYDYCTANYLKQAGCSLVEHIELGTVGIHGNGHMMFMEMNSNEVQGLLRDWIVKVRASQVWRKATMLVI